MAKAASAIEKAALRLRKANETGKPCDPIRDLVGVDNLDAAYAAQEINTRYWVDQGRRLVGRKIGLTSKAIQDQLGVHQPDYGMLFADMAVSDSEEVPVTNVMQPRVEGEVAFIMGERLDDPRLTIVDIINAVDYALPAIEILGCRVANWNIKIADTIADNASSGLFVLGTQPVDISDINLRECGMVMERRGEQICVGAGVACLGNPLNAALWLARKMAEIGRPLEEGDIIMSGSLGPMMPVDHGDVIEVDISNLGSVRAVFAKKG